MLLRIRDFLKEQKVASNQQMAREFRIDLSALQPLLEFWVNKGTIAACLENSSCKSRCVKCKSGQPPVYYQFI